MAERPSLSRRVVGEAVVGANLMFDLPAVDVAQTGRSGVGLWLGEFIATFGLLTVIWGAVRLHAGATVAAAVGTYVMAAIWFTSSTTVRPIAAGAGNRRENPG